MTMIILINSFLSLKDFEKMIPPLVQKNHAGYYFVRLDTISELSGHNWLLITYIPDEAPVN